MLQEKLQIRGIISYLTFWIEVSYELKFDITFQNNFIGGNIVAGLVGDNNPKDNPANLKDLTIGQNLFISAIEQTPACDSLRRVWTSNSAWIKISAAGNVTSVTSQPSTSFTTTYDDTDATYKANFMRVFKTTIRNDINGNYGLGSITYNGGNLPSPYSFDIVEMQGFPVNAQAQSIIEDANIIYYFDHWEKDGQYYSDLSTINFTASRKETYTAKYKGYADKSIAPHVTSTSNDHTKVTFGWTEYPNPNVSQYQIYRRAEHIQGGDDIRSLIATVPRGTTSYTDQYYYINNSGNYNLYYEVLPYFTSQGTYAHSLPEKNMFAFMGSKTGYGEGGEVLNKKSDAAMNFEYSLSNYPNPFNPSTVISYSLKYNGFVNIVIFDIMGNKICDLVNEYNEAGIHNVTFNGSNLPSGYYICRIKSGGFNDFRKLLLIK